MGWISLEILDLHASAKTISSAAYFVIQTQLSFNVKHKVEIGKLKKAKGYALIYLNLQFPVDFVIIRLKDKRGLELQNSTHAVCGISTKALEGEKWWLMGSKSKKIADCKLLISASVENSSIAPDGHIGLEELFHVNQVTIKQRKTKGESLSLGVIKLESTFDVTCEVPGTKVRKTLFIVKERVDKKLLEKFKLGSRLHVRLDAMHPVTHEVFFYVLANTKPRWLEWTMFTPDNKPVCSLTTKQGSLQVSGPDRQLLYTLNPPDKNKMGSAKLMFKHISGREDGYLQQKDFLSTVAVEKMHNVLSFPQLEGSFFSSYQKGSAILAAIAYHYGFYTSGGNFSRIAVLGAQAGWVAGMAAGSTGASLASDANKLVKVGKDLLNFGVNQTTDNTANLLTEKVEDIALETLDNGEDLLELLPELQYLSEAKEITVKKRVSLTDALSLGVAEGNHTYDVFDPFLYKGKKNLRLLRIKETTTASSRLFGKITKALGIGVGRVGVLTLVISHGTKGNTLFAMETENGTLWKIYSITGHVVGVIENENGKSLRLLRGDYSQMSTVLNTKLGFVEKDFGITHVDGKKDGKIRREYSGVVKEALSDSNFNVTFPTRHTCDAQHKLILTIATICIDYLWCSKEVAGKLGSLAVVAGLAVATQGLSLSATAGELGKHILESAGLDQKAADWYQTTIDNICAYGDDTKKEVEFPTQRTLKFPGNVELWSYASADLQNRLKQELQVRAKTRSERKHKAKVLELTRTSNILTVWVEDEERNVFEVQLEVEKKTSVSGVVMKIGKSLGVKTKNIYGLYQAIGNRVLYRLRSTDKIMAVIKEWHDAPFFLNMKLIEPHDPLEYIITHQGNIYRHQERIWLKIWLSWTETEELFQLNLPCKVVDIKLLGISQFQEEGRDAEKALTLTGETEMERKLTLTSKYGLMVFSGDNMKTILRDTLEISSAVDVLLPGETLVLKKLDAADLKFLREKKAQSKKRGSLLGSGKGSALLRLESEANVLKQKEAEEEQEKTTLKTVGTANVLKVFISLHQAKSVPVELPVNSAILSELIRNKCKLAPDCQLFEVTKGLGCWGVRPLADTEDLQKVVGSWGARVVKLVFCNPETLEEIKKETFSTSSELVVAGSGSGLKKGSGITSIVSKIKKEKPEEEIVRKTTKLEKGLIANVIRADSMTEVNQAITKSVTKGAVQLMAANEKLIDVASTAAGKKKVVKKKKKQNTGGEEEEEEGGAEKKPLKKKKKSTTESSPEGTEKKTAKKKTAKKKEGTDEETGTSSPKKKKVTTKKAGSTLSSTILNVQKAVKKAIGGQGEEEGGEETLDKGSCSSKTEGKRKSKVKRKPEGETLGKSRNVGLSQAESKRKKKKKKKIGFVHSLLRGASQGGQDTGNYNLSVNTSDGAGMEAGKTTLLSTQGAAITTTTVVVGTNDGWEQDYGEEESEDYEYDYEYEETESDNYEYEDDYEEDGYEEEGAADNEEGDDGNDDLGGDDDGGGDFY